MKTRLIWNGMLAAIGLVFLLGACFAPVPTTAQMSPAPLPTPAPSSPPPSPPATPPMVNDTCPSVIGVDGSSLSYVPSSCTIRLNGSSTTITITASNSHPLDSTSDNWPRFLNAALSDQTVTFTAPGVYRFRCRAHFSQGMTGTITVEN